MASEWELGMGMEFGYGMGIGASVSPSLIIASAATHAPNYQPAAMNSSAYLYGLPSTDTLRIDDLLDFSSHDVLISSSSSAAAAANPNTNTDADGLIIPKQEIRSSSVTAAGSRPFAGESGSSHSHVSSFADDIYIPTEEAAELEWLSKFVEDSFSDVPYPSNYLPAGAHVRMGPAAAAAAAAAGRGARSKRSRAAATNLKPPALAAVPNQASSPTSTSSSSSSDFPTPAHISTGGVSSGRKMAVNEAFVGMEGGVRRCTHCASEKTPQWRTGPLGPKTLCNACGVRYKSGRLVPEYRPAASPTFVLTQHSNSHRKVVELRRQKEQLHSYHQDPNPCNSSAAAANAIIYH